LLSFESVDWIDIPGLRLQVSLKSIGTAIPVWDRVWIELIKYYGNSPGHAIIPLSSMNAVTSLPRGRNGHPSCFAQAAFSGGAAKRTSCPFDFRARERANIGWTSPRDPKVARTIFMGWMNGFSRTAGMQCEIPGMVNLTCSTNRSSLRALLDHLLPYLFSLLLTQFIKFRVRCSQLLLGG